MLASLLGVSFVVAFVLHNYLHISVFESLTFYGADGWCDSRAEGFGQHCWGDYAAIRFQSLSEPPVGPEAPYPLGSRLVRLPFFVLGNAWGYDAEIAAFVIVSAICMLVPIVWAVREANWPVRAVVVTVAGVVTMPFLFVMDRGNLIGFAVPFMFLFLIGLVKERPWLAVIGVVGASVIKPQFALLLLAFVALRQLRPFLVSSLATALGFLLPFVVLGGQWATGLASWRTASLEWAVSQPVSADWPANLSIARSIHSWTRLVVAGLQGMGVLPPSAGGFDEAQSAFVAVVLVGVAMALLAWRGTRLPPLVLGAALLAIASLTLPLSFGYYSVFCLPVAAVFLRSGIGERLAGQLTQSGMAPAMTVALALSMTPLLLPRAHERATIGGQGDIVASWTPLLATSAWLAFLGVVGASVVRGRMEAQGGAFGRSDVRPHDAGDSAFP